MTKVQTGLRIPEDRYEVLKQLAERSGVSINAMALMMIDVGMHAVNLGTKEAVDSLLRILEDKDG